MNHIIQVRAGERTVLTDDWTFGRVRDTNPEHMGIVWMKDVNQ